MTLDEAKKVIEVCLCCGDSMYYRMMIAELNERFPEFLWKVEDVYEPKITVRERSEIGANPQSADSPQGTR